MTVLTDIAPPANLRASARDDARYLFNPVVDFLCLGGGSLIVLATLRWWPPNHG